MSPQVPETFSVGDVEKRMAIILIALTVVEVKGYAGNADVGRVSQRHDHIMEHACLKCYRRKISVEASGLADEKEV